MPWGTFGKIGVSPVSPTVRRSALVFLHLHLPLGIASRTKAQLTNKTLAGRRKAGCAGDGGLACPGEESHIR